MPLGMRVLAETVFMLLIKLYMNHFGVVQELLT